MVVVVVAAAVLAGGDGARGPGGSAGDDEVRGPGDDGAARPPLLARLPHGHDSSARVAAQRSRAAAPIGPPSAMRLERPGGVIYAPGSPHDRDLRETPYRSERHLDAPFTTAEIIADGTARRGARS